MKDGKTKLLFVILTIAGYLIADYNLLSIYMPLYNLSDYFGYYNIYTQQYLLGAFNILGSLNIILTTFDDDEYVYNALKFGASGYLLKGVSMDELENAIRMVYNGRAMISPDIATKVLKLFSRMAQSDYTIPVGNRGMEELTKTEWKIIAQGGSGIEKAVQMALATGACCLAGYDALSGLKPLSELKKKIDQGWARNKFAGK